MVWVGARWGNGPGRDLICWVAADLVVPETDDFNSYGVMHAVQEQ